MWRTSHIYAIDRLWLINDLLMIKPYGSTNFRSSRRRHGGGASLLVDAGQFVN